MHWGMSDSRWTIIPPWLVWPLAVSLWQRAPLFAQVLQKSWCLSLQYLGLAAWGEQVHSADRSYGSVVGTFPSANESNRNWFVKWISVKERWVWEPSAHPTYAGKVCGWEKKQGEPQWYILCYFLLLLLSSSRTREDPGLSSSTINGKAALPPCFFGSAPFPWLVPLYTQVMSLFCALTKAKIKIKRGQSLLFEQPVYGCHRKTQ